VQIVCIILCAVFLVGMLVYAEESAAPTNPLLSLSHIAPHIHATGLSQLYPHAAVKPPPELICSLTEGNGGIIKGYSPEWEGRLARELLAVNLRHDIMRVAVGSYNGQLMGLVKLQASDKYGRRFDAKALQEDAVTALSVAFQLDPQMQSVDVWAVVPANGTHDYDHLPVFSAYATRQDFFRATDEPRSSSLALAGLGLVRLSPTYLQYACCAGLDLLSMVPPTVYDTTPMLDNWEAHVAEAQARLAAANGARIDVLEGTNDGHGMAALTIDDGPHPLTTPLMLAVLRDRGVHATFFLVAEKAEEYPELVRRIVAEGHEIANHSYSHRRAHELNSAQMLAELTTCQRVLGGLTGVNTRYFRPPGGRLNEPGLQAIAVSGHALVMWTTNADDWLKPAPSVIAANALKGLRPGGIVLMHQGSMESFNALPLIIDGAGQRGLRLCTVSELLAAGAAKITRMTTQEAMRHLQRLGFERE